MHYECKIKGGNDMKMKQRFSRAQQCNSVNSIDTGRVRDEVLASRVKGRFKSREETGLLYRATPTTCIHK